MFCVIFVVRLECLTYFDKAITTLGGVMKDEFGKSHFTPADLFSIGPSGIQKGWMPLKDFPVPTITLGSFSNRRKILFLPDDEGRTIESGRFGLVADSRKMKVFPILPGDNPQVALAIVHVLPRSKAPRTAARLPVQCEFPCPFQGRQVSLDREVECPLCGTDLSEFFIREGYRGKDTPVKTYFYSHPDSGLVLRYMPLIDSNNQVDVGPRLYWSEPVTGVWIVEFKPGDCGMFSGARRELILWGLDGIWYRSPDIETLKATGQYGMQNTMDYLSRLSEVEKRALFDK